ncbi:unnamed protein product, partial [Cladocopium goreaui]
MATKTACFSDHGFPRHLERLELDSAVEGSHLSAPSPAQPLDEADLDSEMGLSFARQISPNCRLVDCKVPSPTCADAPDDTRLEFKDFKKQAQSLASEFFCSQDVEGMVASVRGLGCLPFHDELAASLLRASLDQKDVTRQAVIPLLIALHEEELMSTAQLARGFEKLVLSWEDLQLDVPGAPGLLVSLLSSRVGLFDKSLFARLPEDLLSRVSCDLPTNLAQRTIQTHLEELRATWHARLVAPKNLQGWVRAFKTELHCKIQEHLLRMGTADGLAAWLREECKPAFHHEVVVAACLCSFDGKPSPDAYWTSCFDSGDLRAEKCRMVLDALVQLANSEHLLSETDIQIGFSRVLGIVTTDTREMEATETRSDFPHLVALLRGAVEKELLAAQFLKLARRLGYGGPLGMQALRWAQRQTPLHSRRVWGSGDLRQMRAEMHDTIEEYFDSHSTEELAQVIEELHLSSKEQARFWEEGDHLLGTCHKVTFLRKLLVAGMERGAQQVALYATEELLGFCWTDQEVEGAFQQLRDIEADLVLDFPEIRECTGKLVKLAVPRLGRFSGRGVFEFQASLRESLSYMTVQFACRTFESPVSGGRADLKLARPRTGRAAHGPSKQDT